MDGFEDPVANNATFIKCTKLILSNTRDKLQFNKFVAEQFDGCVNTALESNKEILFELLLRTHRNFCSAVNSIDVDDEEDSKLKIKDDFWEQLTIQGKNFCSKHLRHDDQIWEDSPLSSSSSSSSS